VKKVFDFCQLLSNFLDFTLVQIDFISLGKEGVVSLLSDTCTILNLKTKYYTRKICLQSTSQSGFAYWHNILKQFHIENLL
jgi:hypothetical protein